MFLSTLGAMFLYTIFKDGKVYFQTYSDALISQGLGTILCYLYSNLPPREVLTSSPIVLKKIGILSQISFIFNCPFNFTINHHQFKRQMVVWMIQIMKKHRCCASNSNPGLQEVNDGRHSQIN